MLVETVAVLKPRGIGELLDQAIRLYRNNFWKFIGIMAVMQIPIQLLNLIISFLTYGRTIQNLAGAQIPAGEQAFSWIMSQMGPGFLGSLVVVILSFVLVLGFAGAALTRAITDSYLGIETGIEDAYGKIGSTWSSILSAFILLALFNIPLLIWTVIPCIGWFTGVGILFFVNAVVSLLIAPIVVIEKRSGSQALRRAWELARKRFWWMVGYMLLLFLFSLLVIQGPVSIITAIFQSRIRAGQDPASLFTAQMIFQSLAALVFGLLYQPLQSTCATLAYFDLRVRLEGFDLAVMANQSVKEPVAAFELAGQAPAAGNGPLVTMREMGNFALLSLIGAGIYFLLILFFLLLGGIVSGF